MLNLLLSGACGRMGHAISEACRDSETRRIVAGVDSNAAAGALGNPYPVYEKITDFEGKADCIIDFSHHSALPALLSYAVSHQTPLVVATTGHTEEELAQMHEASKHIPVFYSRNMSLGVNLLIELTKKATAVLKDSFDIEIVERHHNQKLDAPSGTALMIADAAAELFDEKPEYVYDRHSERRVRSKNEIGIHSVRGGTIVGEHEISFCGENEVITLSHSAYSRTVFASGALAAASFLAGKTAGLYDMSAMIAETI